MRFSIVLLLFSILVFFSCETDAGTQDAQKDPTKTAVAEDKKEEIKIIRLPVDINPSTEKDYPEDLIALGFPINPNAEVKNMGSTRIMEEGMLLQLNTYDKMEEVVEYYSKEMIARGWEEKKIKIFQGADTALKFDKDGLTCRFTIIHEEDQDYRKIAVMVNKVLDISKY